MKYLTVDQIRAKFLDFFIAKGHHKLPSFPLVPQNDNSMLLIGAGMAPMKPFFTGQATPPASRVTTVQKCVRTGDIDDVGYKARYVSFFEMLGNFSFGDYFKKEVIPWAWAFVTQEMQIPVDKLWISVFHEDDEAAEIWQRDVGLPAERIVRLGREDNFWELEVGPCGPSSEIHYDRGVDAGCGQPDCAVGCDCDRFLEIWNLVFIQLNKDAAGNYTPLETTGIDTGSGLERMAMVVQGVDSVYEIDNMARIMDDVRKLMPAPTHEPKELLALKIIADHLRAVTFLASDGVRPGADGRDYVMRRLLRRAVRYGKSIGLDKFVRIIAEKIINDYEHAYPTLREKADFILQTLAAEENRFLETLDTGLALLQKHIDELKKSGASQLPGADAFKLYDTFGFPPDITREIVAEAGLAFDQDGFDAEMAAQKERARAARGSSNYMGAEETIYHQLPPNLPTEFTGYAPNAPDPAAFRANIVAEGEVLALIADDTIAQTANKGQKVSVVVSRTPFYAASGGQASDNGIITNGDAWTIAVSDCVKVAGGNTVHIGYVMDGTVRMGDPARAIINHPHRFESARNHTATHLLQRALREVVGDHIEQAGSEVTPERLRFDFTHHAPLTPDQRDQLETRINAIILGAHRVQTLETTPEEARQAGAMALFGEKYGDTVRMVTIGGTTPNHEHIDNYSVELCGGTHVANTSEIGAFKLISESGIAAGVRRIEAVTGYIAIDLYRAASAKVAELAELLKTPQADLTARIAALSTENRELKKAADRARAEASKGQLEDVAAKLLAEATQHNGHALITAKLDNYDIEALRNLADKIKAAPAFASGGCLLLAATSADSVQFLASATDNAVKSGLHAGNIVKAAAQICGGNGGGRPNHAQAGGKDASQADAALATGLAMMKEQIQ
ncbi:MAG: alanine--tRNA ligase [Defluviitaleaceae bacterium]|nr:alanine--tRNA ligase [Defluviitaleaceae bacterium]